MHQAEHRIHVSANDLAKANDSFRNTLLRPVVRVVAKRVVAPEQAELVLVCMRDLEENGTDLVRLNPLSDVQVLLLGLLAHVDCKHAPHNCKRQVLPSRLGVAAHEDVFSPVARLVRRDAFPVDAQRFAGHHGLKLLRWDLEVASHFHDEALELVLAPQQPFKTKRVLRVHA